MDRPARLLFVSTFGQTADLAWQVTKEGGEARMWIQSKAEREVGDGFVEKVDDWKGNVEWADAVVFDDTGFGAACERLRADGKPVVGGTTWSDRMELDRDFGQAEMKAAGLNVLPSWDFDSFDDAIRFVRETPGRYVVKPNGKAQNEKVLSYVGQEEDGKDVVSVLETYKRGWGSKIRGFQVQAFVSGVEVAVGAFFDGRDFVLPCCVNFEHKRLFNEEIGPSTGEMGTSMFWTGEGPLFRATLAPLRTRLAEARYVGYFDVNCIANSRGVFPLEATSRFGCPTYNIQMDGVLTRWSDLLAGLARGEAPTLRTKKGFQVGVVVAVPPYPFEDPAAFRRYSEDAVVMFRRPLPEGVHPADVKLVDGDWRLTGSSGYALVVTGTASTMVDARKEAYGRVRAIVIPNMFYRTDVGERWVRDGDLLQSWGLL